jgi:multidrug efflux pump subunit AcrB
MMWLVRIALKQKYTFIVVALLIAILGTLSIDRTPTDIFPNIDIPVVSVVWSYGGLPPKDMERRIVTIAERAYTTTVNDIEHIESQSLPGTSVIKVFFQPGTRVEAAVAQLAAISSTLLRIFPPGTTPPGIIIYNASNVPVIQIGVSSNTLSEQQIQDYAQNFVRTQLVTVQGASVMYPLGGKQRVIAVDLDMEQLRAKGINPADVGNALNLQNLILPGGTTKIGDREYNVFLNSSPDQFEALNNMPIKVVNGTTIYVRDVAHVHDGYFPQTNLVNLGGRRSAIITISKSGAASTLSVVSRIKAYLPFVASTVPKALKLSTLLDQSVFIRATISGVVKEAIIAASLTGLMILLFLGSVRSTFIVCISIPLSILSSLIILGALGQTINIMTLGGLALAVGILVDDATVAIENINRNLGMGKSLLRAILDGSEQIATPTFVSTICICIVFAPVVFLAGAARSLFMPMGMAVVFAMLSSYLLSRTVVPVLFRMLMGKEADRIRAGESGDVLEDDIHDALTGRTGRAEHNGDDTGNGHAAAHAASEDVVWRVHKAFDGLFERARARYMRLLYWALTHRRAAGIGFGLFFASAVIPIPFIGQDFFPTVDAGQIRVHIRAPSGTRLEETEHWFHKVEEGVRTIIPAREIELMTDRVGLPNGFFLANSDSITVGPSDGELLISLKEGEHGPTQEYIAKMRRELPRLFPNLTFFFQPADIVTQILNFGLPAPIDVQVIGRDPSNLAIAKSIADKVRRVRGAVDVYGLQVTDVPSFNVNVDRERAATVGLTQTDVANSVLYALTGSAQVNPNYWVDPKMGVNYTVNTQAPQRDIDSAAALKNIPITPANGTVANQQLLGNLAQVSRSEAVQNVSHYNVQPTYDVLVNVQGRDLGGVARDVQRIMDGVKLPRGTLIHMRGQVQSMNDSFIGLGLGLIFAIVLVYFLMVVNFQSWVDPFIIITALPGALCGILWMLYLSHTTFSVPALMGAIMCVGVASANSILVVTFANDRRHEGDDSLRAALGAGFTRLRPVVMTAAAMIIGMMPMALGLGEGGEQNAPLGRAVVGGLSVATITTLLFVPIVYSYIHRHGRYDASHDEAIENYLLSGAEPPVAMR